MTATTETPAAPTVESVLAGAMQLSHEDRAALVEQIVPTLWDNEDELPASQRDDVSFEQTLARRVQELHDGTAKTVPSEEVHRRVRAHLAARRAEDAARDSD